MDRHPDQLWCVFTRPSALFPMHLTLCSSLLPAEAEEHNYSEHGHWVREIGLASQLCRLLAVLLSFSEPRFLQL